MSALSIHTFAIQILHAPTMLAHIHAPVTPGTLEMAPPVQISMSALQTHTIVALTLTVEILRDHSPAHVTPGTLEMAPLV